MSRKLLYKIVIVGAAGCGKTTMAVQFASGNALVDAPAPTVGVDFLSKHLGAINGQETTLQIWDTAGAESFDALAPAFLRGSHGIVLVFDVTNAASLAVLKTQFVSAICRHMGLDSLSRDVARNPRCVLVGNKCDQIEARVVTRAAAEAVASELGIAYFETQCCDTSESFADLDRVFRFVATAIRAQTEVSLPMMLSMLSTMSGRIQLQKREPQQNPCCN
jgi:small GTP-binding protein